MELPKIELEPEKLDINLKFYFFLKYIIKAEFRDNQVLHFLENAGLFNGFSQLVSFKASVLESISIKTKSGQKQRLLLKDIFAEIDDDLSLDTFLFSLRLYLIKDLLLEEAKIRRANDIEKLKQLNPLSLEYDKITVFNPYTARVTGALLSLAFFENLKTGFLARSSDDFIQNLVRNAQNLIHKGIEPNQIFMLVLNESLNQSITSNSGSDYENRIKSVLLNLGVSENSIRKMHDKADSSTEFDFFFELEGKTFGISAKRTLRERYKQFIKTAQMSDIDVMMEITLGTDLSEEKAKAIVQHGVILFVADEIYQSQTYLHNMPEVYSCCDLSLDLFKELALKSSCSAV